MEAKNSFQIHLAGDRTLHPFSRGLLWNLRNDYNIWLKFGWKYSIFNKNLHMKKPSRFYSTNFNYLFLASVYDSQKKFQI